MTDAHFSNPYSEAWNQVWNLCQDQAFLASVGYTFIAGDGIEMRIAKGATVVVIGHDNGHSKIYARVGGVGQIIWMTPSWSESGSVELTPKGLPPMSVQDTISWLINRATT
jgi:hypothetical protein